MFHQGRRKSGTFHWTESEENCCCHVGRISLLSLTNDKRSFPCVWSRSIIAIQSVELLCNCFYGCSRWSWFIKIIMRNICMRQLYLLLQIVLDQLVFNQRRNGLEFVIVLEDKSRTVFHDFERFGISQILHIEWKK